MENEVALGNMLQKADILLMDEPTNVDVKNVKWVKSYINSLKYNSNYGFSHSGLLDECCDYILQIDRMKLNFIRVI